jgi:hypothetical protein
MGVQFTQGIIRCTAVTNHCQCSFPTRMNMLARIFHIMYDRHYSSNNDRRDSEVLPNDRASRSGYTIRATIKPHTYA